MQPAVKEKELRIHIQLSRKWVRFPSSNMLITRRMSMG